MRHGGGGGKPGNQDNIAIICSFPGNDVRYHKSEDTGADNRQPANHFP
jgi:hypothetical protein